MSTDSTVQVDDDREGDLAEENDRLEERLSDLEAARERQDAQITALQNRNELLVDLLFNMDKWEDGVYTDALDAGVFDPLVERQDALETESDERLSALESSVAAIADLGMEKTTREAKVAAIVQYALNQVEGTSESVVILRPKEIKGIAGVGLRYAYDLVDELPEQFDFFKDKSKVAQYGSLEIDKDSQHKAMLVDVELLQQDRESLNLFNNRRGGTGGQ